MIKRIAVFATFLMLFATVTAPVLAQGAVPGTGVNYTWLLPVALMLFLPIGLILLISSAMPEERAPAAAINLLVVWAVAVLGYFFVGFALNFGGIAQITPQPDLAGLYWEWYPFDQSVDADVARLWGVVALRGWALSGEATTTGALLLFLSNASLVGASAMIPAGVLLERGRGAAAVFAGLLVGTLIYPVAGNWLWGGGWLSNLGASLELGHGFVDFGGASVVFLIGAAVALAALLLFRPAAVETTLPEQLPHSENELPDATPMPSAYLPILSMLGGGLVLMGWFGLSSGLQNPTTINISPEHAAVAGLLAALGGAFSAAAYSWFTTQVANPLMTSRGLLAGLIVGIAGAPFMPIWISLVAGLLMGLILPPLIYLLNNKLRLVDTLGTLTTFGISGFISLLLVGFFADGTAGQNWNRVGPVDYLGVSGQGVSALVVAPDYVADWPGQIQAQLLGGGAVFVWALLLSAILFQIYLAVANAWARTKSVEEVEPPPAAEPESEIIGPTPGDDTPAAL